MGFIGESKGKTHSAAKHTYRTMGHDYRILLENLTPYKAFL